MNNLNVKQLGLSVLAVLAIAGANAQSGIHKDHQTMPATKDNAMSSMDMSKHMAMMKAGEVKLDALIAKMNNALGSDKVDATAAVVGELVLQQKQMGAMCMGMMNMKMSPMSSKAKKASQMGKMMSQMDMSKQMDMMKAGESKLATLVQKMNNAQGTDKTDATAAVVGELVSQQKQMGAMCMGMMNMKMTSPDKGATTKHHGS